MALIGEMDYLTIGGNTYSIPKYSLPIASASTLGGVRVGTGLTIESGTGILSATGTDVTIDSEMSDSSHNPVQNQTIKAYIDQYKGTVTSVRVQATSPVQSSVSTAQNETLNTTISLANGYGDTKNPYGTKTANYVLAGPTTGTATAPTFRKLVVADIPDLSETYLTSYTETDPTVPSWAKASTKPSYTASEVGAASSSHTHGNITNGGDITATAPTIANGDQIIINDNSASKITNGPTFDGSTTTTALTPKGTWESFSKFSGSYNDLSNKPTIPTVPTAISAFTNDAGYITSADVPEGASAYTGTISAVSTAASSGTNNGFARGDHVHNITSSTITSALGYTPYDSTNPNGYISSYTDEKLKWTASTTSNTYYPLQSTSTATTSTANTLNGISFYQYYNTAGGYRRLNLGNSTAYKSTGGAYGTIRLYGAAATYYGDLVPGVLGTTSGDGHISANRTWTLPDKTGTIALISDIPTTLPASDVSAWAKATSKPTYTASEVGALASNTTYVSTISTTAGTHSTISSKSGAVSFNVPTKTSHLTNDSGFLTSYTETDPVFSASAAAGITSTDISNWNAKVSDDKTWNGVTLNRNVYSQESDKYIPFISGTNTNGTNAYYTKSTSTPTANYIAQYDNNSYLYSKTPSANDNSTKVATTAYVDAAIPDVSGYLTSSSTLNAAKLSGTVPSSCYTDTNTTYALSNALSSHKFTSTLTAGGSGSGTSTATMEFVAGTGITLTDDTTNKKITIASSVVNTNTTYALSGALSSHKFTSTLTAGGSGSGTSTSDFTLAAGTGITITDDTSARKMTIACSVTNTNTTYALSNALSSHKFTSTLTAGGSGSGTSTATMEFVAGTGITLTDDTTNKKITIGCSVTNTDAKVTQSADTSSSWRKVLIHYTTNSSGGAVPSTVTNQVYAAKGIEVQPSTGTLHADALTTKKVTSLITGGTETAAVTTSPYKPALWKFNAGIVPAEGDIVVIQAPGPGHSYGEFLSLDNGTTYKPITHSGNNKMTTHYYTGSAIALVYDADWTTGSMYPVAGGTTVGTITGGAWRVINGYLDGNTYTSAYCSTAAGTAAKAATMHGYVATAQRLVMVTITTANTAASALTMNINGTGAKPIYINGSASSSSNYTLPAGSYLVYYNGTNYYFRTDGILQSASGVLTSHAAASGGTANSLCTTGEKYTWNTKANYGDFQVVSHATGTITNSGAVTDNTLSISKSGYYPLGVVGWYCSGSLVSFLNIFRANVTSRANGSGTITYSHRITGYSGSSTLNGTITFDVLWVLVR